MKVSELREIMQDLEDEAEIRIVEFGYRSSNQSSVGSAYIVEDFRESDDYGHDQQPLGEVLYIEVGSTSGNRYPIRAEAGEDY